MDTPTTEIYPLPLPDALPIFASLRRYRQRLADLLRALSVTERAAPIAPEFREALARELAASGDAERIQQRNRGEVRSEEHTSELQSQSNLVCRLLLEKTNHDADLLTPPKASTKPDTLTTPHIYHLTASPASDRDPASQVTPHPPPIPLRPSARLFRYY